MLTKKLMLIFLVILNQVNIDKKVDVYLGMSGNSLESDTYLAKIVHPKKLQRLGEHIFPTLCSESMSM